MFLIKQVSSDLGITPQAIYKQKDDLMGKGYMFKNEANDWEITADGYNYLKEKLVSKIVCYKRKLVCVICIDCKRNCVWF